MQLLGKIDCSSVAFIVAGKKREFRFHPIKETIVEEPVDITPFLDQLDESLKDKVLQLQKGRLVSFGPVTFCVDLFGETPHQTFQSCCAMLPAPERFSQSSRHPTQVLQEISRRFSKVLR